MSSNKEELFNKNQRLVGMALKRLGIFPDNEMYEDYQQVGYIGLVKAARKFNPELGFTFSTYAIPMIEGEIRRERRDNGNILKISRKIRETHYQYRQMEERGYEEDKICEKLGISMKQLNDIKNAYIPVFSLDAPNLEVQKKDNNGKVILLGDSLASDSDLEEECIGNVYWEQILSCLNEIERACVKLRSKEMSQSQIAKRVGVSQVQVSRILSNAKSKILQLLEKAS